MGGPEGGGQKVGAATGPGGRGRKREPPPAMRMGGGGRRGCLGNLSVLCEMSAEINLANPPRWPVTLISLKFQAD